MYYVLNSKILPQVRLANQAVIQPPYIHKKRTPQEFIIYLVKKGEMYLKENHREYHMIPGDFLVMSPEKCHEGIRATYCEYYYIHFFHPEITEMDDDTLNDHEIWEHMMKIRKETLKSDSCDILPEICHELILPKYGHIQDESIMAGMNELLHKAISANCDHMEGYKTLCGCFVLQFMIQLSRQYLSQELQDSGLSNVRSYKTLLEVQNYLENSYADPVTGDLLAEKFDMNFDYMNRLFRKNMGKPIFQYLSEVRIAHAKELLTTSSMRIGQISETVGFSDQSYFSKVFKKHTGVSPADYAKSSF